MDAIKSLLVSRGHIVAVDSPMFLGTFKLREDGTMQRFQIAQHPHCNSIYYAWEKIDGVKTAVADRHRSPEEAFEALQVMAEEV